MNITLSQPVRHLAYLARIFTATFLLVLTVHTALGDTTIPNGTGNGNVAVATCCDCLKFEVQKQADTPDGPMNVPFASNSGMIQVKVTITHEGLPNCPATISGKVNVNSEENRVNLPEQAFTVTTNQTVTLTFEIAADQRLKCSQWIFNLSCDGDGNCKTEYLPLGGCYSCSSGNCDGASGEPSFTGDSFKVSFPTTQSNGGMGNGELVYYKPDFSFAGRAGLFANVSPDFVVLKDGNGLITEIQTGVSKLEVADVVGEQAFTVIHKYPSGIVFRTSKVSFVNEGGKDRLRVDSTYDGVTRRHEQTQPQPGTLIMERGTVVGINFNVLTRETLVKDTSTAGIEVRRSTIEERSNASVAWSSSSVSSDVETTWEKQVHGWVKSKQVIDPDGAALTTTWTYYQPGEASGPGASNVGLGRLKHLVRYDGSEAFYTYTPNTTTVTTPYAGNVTGKTTTTTWSQVNQAETVTETVNGQIISKTVTAYTPTTTTQTVYTSASETLTTVTTHTPSGQDFGGKPVKTLHADGTLTTYSYTRVAGGGYTTVTENGSTTSGTSVSQGMRSISTTNSRGTTILRKTEAIGYGSANGLVYDLMAVTEVDNLGRATTTAYHPTSATVTGEFASASSPAWITETEYSCCGIASQTDKYGITTYYAYDELQRPIKSNSLGVTTETVRNGLTTETFRYAETVGASLTSTFGGTSASLVSRSVGNLSGTLQESWSPNPTSTTNGALVISSSSVTTFQPAAGLSSRTVTTTADGVSQQTTDSFLDGRTAKTYGALSPAMEYSYSVNSTGELTSQSYLDGTNLRETTTSQSDWAGRTLRVDYMDGAFATMNYNALGQIEKSTDPDGIVTLMAYNAEGEQIITAIDLPEDENTPRNGIIDYGIDTVSYTDTDPAIGTIKDALGNDVTGPVWKTTSSVWQPGDNEFGDATVVSTSLRSANGLLSSSQSIGVEFPSRSETKLLGSGNWTTTGIAPDGTKILSTYTDGKMASMASLAANDSVIESQSQGYDSLNRPVTSTHSRTGASTTNYLSNTADIVTSVSDPGNRTTAFVYDIRGRQISTTLPDNTATQSTYTSRNELASQSGSQTYPTSYTYDYAGRMKTLKTSGAAGDSITAWNYSTTKGMLISKKYDSNLSGTTGTGPTYTYTAAGRTKTRTWASGKHTRYDYDLGGRLTTTHYFTAASADNGSNAGNDSATPNVLVNYDALNRPTQVSNKTANTSYSYNASNITLASETVSYDWNHDETPDLIRVIDRTRDNLRRPAGFEVKDGTAVESSIGYNFSATHGRLASVSSGGGLNPPSQFNYTYVPNSNLIATVTSPAHTVSNVYEPTRDVLASKVNKKLDNTTVSSYFYIVNHIGQRTSVDVDGIAFADGQRDRSWGYDSFGQLITETDANNTALNRGFAYDSIGNRTAAIEGNTDTTASGAISYTPNALNQYTSVGTFTPTNDDDGNTIQTQIRASGLGNSTLSQATFVWDGENRLIEVKNSSGNTIAQYSYDSMSRRVRREVTGGANIAYVYNGWNPIAEYDTSSTTPSLRLVNVWGLDLSGSVQGAGGVGGLLAVTLSSEPSAPSFYPSFDGNGNVGEYLDSNGNIVAHFEYDAFGNVVNFTESANGLARKFSHRFSTKQQDDETSLLNYGYRYLDTITGRWSSRDPIEEEGGINLYGFVGNDGVNLFDALGLEWQRVKYEKRSWLSELIFGLDPIVFKQAPTDAEKQQQAQDYIEFMVLVGELQKLESSCSCELSESQLAFKAYLDAQAAEYRIASDIAYEKWQNQVFYDQKYTISPSDNRYIISTAALSSSVGSPATSAVYADMNAGFLLPGGAGTWAFRGSMSGFRSAFLTKNVVTPPAQYPTGSFSITELGWQNYPAGVPKPAGPFRFIEDAEYLAERASANSANNKIRLEQCLRGQPVDVHEIQPVKFGGSATDPANKIILDRRLHRKEVTPWWNQLMKDIKAKRY